MSHPFNLELRGRTLTVALFLCGAIVLPAWGQRANGYVFIAPGGLSCCNGHTDMTLHAGVGGEVNLWKGLGAGAEFGGLGPRDNLSDGLVVGSVNGYYHLPLGAGHKFDPFVTGGYTVLGKLGHANLGNVGVGVNYWFTRHFGLRLEARDHIRTGPSVQYWGVRIGLAIH